MPVMEVEAVLLNDVILDGGTELRLICELQSINISKQFIRYQPAHYENNLRHIIKINLSASRQQQHFNYNPVIIHAIVHSV